MRTRFAHSSDGTRIAFTTAGNPDLPSILLIHGWAQQFTCWRPIVEQLSDRFHLVAMDLRGHGASGQPKDPAAYTDTALWGEDVQTVIAAADLKSPILVGWSYGSRVIAAYLATYGDARLSGIALAGGILAIGAAREDWMVGKASPGLDRDLYTDDVPRRLAATARFVEACTAQPLDRALFAELVGANMLCPAFVRRALFSADVDFRPHVGAEVPRDDIPAVVVKDRAEMKPAPADHFQTGEVPRPKRINGCCLVREMIHCPAGDSKAICREGAAFKTMKAGLVIRSSALSIR